ncbi:MAG: hypothetical protein M3O70_15960 [Actinomycetota bacterium]|nr:hypothetical protein [Actinomycetota bacterium]
MLDADVPHPGAQPEPLAFPFAAAHHAIAAIEAKVESLTRFLNDHGDAVAEVRVGFEGSAREGFDQAMDDALADTGNCLRQLEADLADLEQLVAEARRRVEARDDEITAWQQKTQAYDAAVADASRRASTGASA